MSESGNKFAFTLVELLIVIAAVTICLGIFIPSARKARSVAKAVMCTSNLKQLYLGFGQYLDDNSRDIFPLAHYGKNDKGEMGKFWYFGFETFKSIAMPEGRRVLDRKLAKLYKYIKQYDSVEICPAFPYKSPFYKPKYKTKWMTYGINSVLSPNLTSPGSSIVNFNSRVKRPADILLFADSAMVNYWQLPASRTNPMFEEWHYVSKGEPSVHFRHNGRANILYCDGRVAPADPQPDSFGDMLPQLQIGTLQEEIKFE